MNRVIRSIIGTIISMVFATAVFAATARSTVLPDDNMGQLALLSIEQLQYVVVS